MHGHAISVVWRHDSKQVGCDVSLYSDQAAKCILSLMVRYFALSNAGFGCRLFEAELQRQQEEIRAQRQSQVSAQYHMHPGHTIAVCIVTGCCAYGQTVKSRAEICQHVYPEID